MTPIHQTMKFRWMLFGSAAALACALALAGRHNRQASAAPAGAEAAEADANGMVLRAYDVRDLIHRPLDRPLGSGILPPTQLINGNLVAPRPPTLMGGFNPPPPAPDPVDVAASDLATLVTSEVSPGSWAGADASIRRFQDQLLVRQTPDNQRQVAALLQELRASREAGRAVTVQAEWLWLAPGELPRTLRPRGPGVAAGEVDPAAVEKLGPAALYARGRVSCSGGQTVHLLAGRVRTLVQNLDASVGTGSAAFQPEVVQMLSGAALQVTPHVQGDHAAVDLVGFVSNWNDPGEPWRIGQRNEAVLHETHPTTWTSSDHSDGSASIDRLNVPTQELCTTARLPLGRPVLVGGLTLEPDAKGAPRGDAGAAEGRQMYLVLRVDSD